jgi:hypothetical protein
MVRLRLVDIPSWPRRGGDRDENHVSRISVDADLVALTIVVVVLTSSWIKHCTAVVARFAPE